MLLKHIPEDFIVEELIDLNTDDNGNQTYFWLKKRNWTTDSAIRMISKKCGASAKRFKFAGTKDKRAITRQAVSVFKVEPDALNGMKIKDIDIEVIGKGNDPISIGSLNGNHFEIVARELEKDEIDSIKKRKDSVASVGFPNMFGMQRFGMGNTHIIGRLILKGKFEEAAKVIITFSGEDESDDKKSFRKFAEDNWGYWDEILERMPEFMHIERDVASYLAKNPTDFGGSLRQVPKHLRKLYVHAYQSHLWNEALKSADSPPETLPIPGFDTVLGDDPFSEKIREMMQEDEFSLEDFRCKRMPEISLKGDERKAFVIPENIKIGKIENNDLGSGKKVLIKFDLPKGCYATVFLDYLFGKI